MKPNVDVKMVILLYLCRCTKKATFHDEDIDRYFILHMAVV